MSNANALNLAPNCPRNFAFAPEVRTDFRLLEVDEHVLQEVLANG